MNIDEVIRQYVTFGKPVPFKELNIYPITVEDYYRFINSYEILNVRKNELGSIELIQMTYLEFLVAWAHEDVVVYNKMIEMLELCFHVKAENNELFIVYNEKQKPTLKIRDTIITAVEFDEIRRIIMYQNVPEYDDKEIDADVQKAVEDYYKLTTKGIVPPSLDIQIAAVMSHTGISKKEIITMPYRDFKLLFDMVTAEVDYIINKTAAMSGMVKLDKPVEHWIYANKKDKIAKAFCSEQNYEEKMQPVT